MHPSVDRGKTGLGLVSMLSSVVGKLLTLWIAPGSLMQKQVKIAHLKRQGPLIGLPPSNSVAYRQLWNPLRQLNARQQRDLAVNLTGRREGAC
ncbi:hypothetical protein BDW62DRAFT_190120 [Aspergillus aurantiobrunneus]